jgi:hypothetical protein
MARERRALAANSIPPTVEAAGRPRASNPEPAPLEPPKTMPRGLPMPRFHNVIGVVHELACLARCAALEFALLS